MLYTMCTTSRLYVTVRSVDVDVSQPTVSVSFASVSVSWLNVSLSQRSVSMSARNECEGVWLCSHPGVRLDEFAKCYLWQRAASYLIGNRWYIVHVGEHDYASLHVMIMSWKGFGLSSSQAVPDWRRGSCRKNFGPPTMGSIYLVF